MTYLGWALVVVGALIAIMLGLVAWFLWVISTWDDWEGRR